jgi:hypothetical protein
MAGEAGGAGSNSSHQLAAFRASQSLADAQAERTISSGDQQGVGEQHNRRADHRVVRSFPQVLTECWTCFSPPN